MADPMLPKQALSYVDFVRYIMTDSKSQTQTILISKQKRLHTLFKRFRRLKTIRCFAETWQDQCFIKVFRAIFKVRVTVLNALTLTEHRFDHDLPLDQADIVVLFNGRQPGHYNPVGQYDKRFLLYV